MKLFKKIKLLISFLRSEIGRIEHEQQVLNAIRVQEGSRIEMPYLKIEGPEFVSVDSNTTIGKYAWISCLHKAYGQEFYPKLFIGKNIRIGNFCCITVIDDVVIEDGSIISEHFYIADHTHDFNPENPDSLLGRKLEKKGAVRIGKNCFIGMRVTIMPGVELGNNCVVGAHSVVTQSFPPYSIIGGVPAKLIRKYSFETKNWERV